ncbi:MAG: hypothetical protein LQ342_001457 [Letrouitia transgressa]|nr:MAG: hypothetical protein LQ342_001457 [Letrouitia transgressa]
MPSTGKQPQVFPNLTSSRSPNSKNSGAGTSMHNVGRTLSNRGANGMRGGRGGVKKPSSNTNSLNTLSNVLDDADEEEARAEHASLMEELRTRVQKAEEASEEYRRQLNLLQTRLDESLQEHEKLEDQLLKGHQRAEELESEIKQTARQKREMEQLFDSERDAMEKDKAKQQVREEELLSANRRMKESLAQRETRSIEAENENLSATGELEKDSSTPLILTLGEAITRNEISEDAENEDFAPPYVQSDDSQSQPRVITQRDKLIEGLKLELAESQIKIMELENMGGRRLQELEKTMLETRITNARLMEENESFQLLLSEKTLNGDFSKTEVMHPSSGLGSLAEELESAEGESENYRRLEIEAKSLKDQNKALTLYIENIIGRLLSHKEFENVLEKTPDLMSGIAKPDQAKPVDTEKDLPPPPPTKDDEPPPSLLQRARSVVSGPGRRPRPVSQFTPPAHQQPPTDENISKPTSVPLARSSSASTGAHRRSQSEMPMAAPIVNQMYRGPPSTGSGGPLSPGISPQTSVARNPFFANVGAFSSSNPTSRAPSGSRFSQEVVHSSSTSTFSDQSGEVSSKERNISGSNNYPGAVMTQNRLRPLRLVQENNEIESKEDDVAARKKANRASWMPGWFNRGKEQEQKSTGAENNFF